MSEYSTAGARAKRQGLKRETNPYRRDSFKYHEWDDGWLGKSQHFRQPDPRHLQPLPFKL